MVNDNTVEFKPVQRNLFKKWLMVISLLISVMFLLFYLGCLGIISLGNMKQHKSNFRRLLCDSPLTERPRCDTSQGHCEFLS